MALATAVATVFTRTAVITWTTVGAVTAWAVGVARCVARWARLATTTIASAIPRAVAALGAAWAAVVVAAGWAALVLPFTGLTVTFAFTGRALALALATTTGPFA